MPELNDEDSKLLEQAIEAGAVTGWQYNEVERRFERLVSYPHVEVTVNGEDVALDDGGRAKILTQTAGNVDITVYDPTTQESYTQRISGDSTDATVIFDLDISGNVQSFV